MGPNVWQPLQPLKSVGIVRSGARNSYYEGIDKVDH